MQANYPNLELLEYKVKEYLATHEELGAKIRQYWTERGYKVTFGPKLRCDVFLQTWGSTCLGFDVDDDGNAMWGGQAMTDAYTTVFFEEITETYFVFFGGQQCYKVENATEAFLEDLKNRCLKSRSSAMKCY